MPEPQIITDLFDEMERSVTDYGPGAIKIKKRIDGTAFFPGGIGLWRGPLPHGPAPNDFPASPVMILGHNFDSVAEFDRSCHRGIELVEIRTWGLLRRYLEDASVAPEDCFFTNIYVGLQPEKSVGEMESSELLKQQCRDFLHYQIERTRPRLIAILGIPARKQFDLSGCVAPHVKLDHPSYASRCGPGEKQNRIVANSARKLRAALDAACA